MIVGPSGGSVEWVTTALLLGKVFVLRCAPTVLLVPAHTLTPEDGADLTPFERDASFLGCQCQPIEAPLDDALFVVGLQTPIRIPD